jgi:hypothetical protein
MKLFIQIATVLAVSLLVCFSQAQMASDCVEKVKKCQDARCRTYWIVMEPKNTPECRKIRKALEKEFGITSFEDTLVDKPKDTISIKPMEKPNLK